MKLVTEADLTEAADAAAVRPLAQALLSELVIDTQQEMAEQVLSRNFEGAGEGLAVLDMLWKLQAAIG